MLNVLQSTLQITLYTHFESLREREREIQRDRQTDTRVLEIHSTSIPYNKIQDRKIGL